MTPERWEQVGKLYHAALALQPDARETFLADTCVDDAAMRREVESLLAAEDGAGSFLAAGAMKDAARILVEDNPLSLVGKELGHYRVLSLLGAGGMGEVYLAEDTRLKRKVALKLLPVELTANRDRLRRFEQEARAASALNHPNILTIHEIGEEDGHKFIATEFVDGETLRPRISSGPMKFGEVLSIAEQSAFALAAAHAAGIIHRDIKPENIMRRRDGIVKVLDFGLAKLTEPKEGRPEDSTRPMIQTGTGMVMGTVHYMSPEQSRGEELDARTDIFSLGVVLYEMVTGKLPFEGKDVHRRVIAIQEQEPRSLSSHVEGVPDRLEEIVAKTLAKEPGERYQTAKDLLIDLRNLKKKIEINEEIERSFTPDKRAVAPTDEGKAPTIGTNEAGAETVAAARSTSSVEYIVSSIRQHKPGTMVALAAIILLSIAGIVSYFSFAHGGKTAIDSIAVLPFTNVNADPNMEYLSDGITESLINSLSQVPHLRMIARGSVFHYKGKEVDPQTVGRELGVQAILLGRVTQHGDNLSISAELVDARDNSRIWGEQYSRRLSDVLQVQEEISREISDKLRLKLSGEEQKLVAKRYTDNVEAYQLYLKGRFYSNKKNEESLKRGVDYFQQAIDKDPNYALAYSGLADSYSTLGSIFLSALTPREALVKTKLAAQKSVDLDDTLAEAHTSLAEQKFRGDWDWSGAEREFKRALALNPNYTRAHEQYSQYLVAMGRFEESFAECKRAQALDPVSPRANMELGFAYYFAGRYDQAIEEYQRALELDPNFLNAHWLLGFAYANKSMPEQAIAESRKAVELSGHGPGALGGLGHVYATLKRRDEAQQVIGELKELAKRRYVSPYSVAVIYARLGEKDAAFEWLEKAYSDGAYGILFLKSEPAWDGLRSEPRFDDLVRRVGLPH